MCASINVCDKLLLFHILYVYLFANYSAVTKRSRNVNSSNSDADSCESLIMNKKGKFEKNKESMSGRNSVANVSIYKAVCISVICRGIYTYN